MTRRQNLQQLPFSTANDGVNEPDPFARHAARDHAAVIRNLATQTRDLPAFYRRLGQHAQALQAGCRAPFRT
jgi:hypothetical protein